MDKAKPFCISKQEVWDAYERVKANHGAAGVDGQSVAAFEENLINNLYKLLESVVVGKLLSSTGAPGRNTQERRRHATVGNTDGGGPHRSDGGQTMPRTESGQALSSRLVRVSTREIGNRSSRSSSAAMLGLRLGARSRHPWFL